MWFWLRPEAALRPLKPRLAPRDAGRLRCRDIGDRHLSADYRQPMLNHGERRVESRRTADSQAGYPMSIKRLGDALVSSVFPAPPLKFRTAGFPQYGFKQEFDRDLR